MKKIISSLSLLVLFISFTMPLFAVAGTQVIGQSCNDGDDCIAGLVCTGNSTCQATVGGTQPYSGGSGSGSVNISVIKGYSDGIIKIINDVFVPVLFAIAFFVFLWGVYKYFILGATEEKSREDGRTFVLWGIICFVVILSVWGLVNIVTSTFNLPTGGTGPKPPTL